MVSAAVTMDTLVAHDSRLAARRHRAAVGRFDSATRLDLWESWVAALDSDDLDDLDDEEDNDG